MSSKIFSFFCSVFLWALVLGSILNLQYRDMRKIIILSVAAFFAFSTISCQKEEIVLPSSPISNVPVGAKKEVAAVSGFLKSIDMNATQTSLPFTIFCAGVKGENVDLGITYNRTEQLSKFSVVWDGKYEVKNDSTFVNLMMIRENTGVVLSEQVYDSSYVNLKTIGVQLDKLLLPKTAVKVRNGSNPSSVAYIKLENGYGAWYKR